MHTLHDRANAEFLSHLFRIILINFDKAIDDSLSHQVKK